MNYCLKYPATFIQSDEIPIAPIHRQVLLRKNRQDEALSFKTFKKTGGKWETASLTLCSGNVASPMRSLKDGTPPSCYGLIIKGSLNTWG
jgi:hypothetical protein